MNATDEKEWLNDENIFEEETEADSEQESINEKPFDAEKIRYDIKSISVRQMHDMINEKQLDLNPGFQRRKVWKENKRKSLLIESLMLRIPLPIFYIYEDEDSVWHVIDGLQRMSTIRDYLDGKFALSGLQYLDCNTKTFLELDQKYKNRITTTSLICNVIDSRTPSQVKLEIFRRINSGGVPLNAQEIRNSVATNRTRDFLHNLASCNDFMEATNYKIDDQRMQAQELVLRFIAFFDVYHLQKNELDYRKGMDVFLDNAFERLNKANPQQLLVYERKFKNAMRNARILFDKHAFRRIVDIERLSPYNKSLFTCESVILAYYKYDDLVNRNIGDLVRNRLYTEIQDNREFNDSLSKSTGDYKNLQIQFTTMRKILKEVIGDAE